MLDLLESELQLPKPRWTKFYRGLETYLKPVGEEGESITGSAYLDFYHDQLRFAVYRRYLGMLSGEDEPTDRFRERNRELAGYFQSIARTCEPPQWTAERPRGVSELPYHQRRAENWEALEATLTDIDFIDAKAKAGMVFDLLRDYMEAERAWPGQEEERRKEEEWRKRMNEYGQALIAYSLAHTARRDDPTIAVQVLPTPLVSVARVSEPERVDTERVWSPVERVWAWGHFVANHTVRLTTREELAFQIAYNSADSGPVADTLEDRLRQGNGPSGSWLQLRFRSSFLLHPVCLKTLEGHTDKVWAVCVTPDGRRAVSGSRDQTLRMWDLDTGESIAIYGSDAGSVLTAAQRFLVLVSGRSSGRVEFLRLVDRQARPLPLLGPRITTAQRLWLCGPGVVGGHWDDAFTAICEACGLRFPSPSAILDTIAAITRNARLGPDDSPCLKLPAEAWDEPHLLSECLLCHEPLRFNPFVVDNRDR